MPPQRFPWQCARALIPLLFTLHTGTALAECRMVETGRLPVEVVDNAVLIQGGLNDHDISILMDTGAQESFLLKSAVDAAGLKPVRDRRYYLNSDEDDSTIYQVKVDRLRVGNTGIDRTLWAVFNIDVGDTGVGMVLGADFWSRTDYEIDLRNGEIILWDNKECEKAALGYWSKEYMIAFLADKNGRHPVVKATVNGTPLQAVIDTGSPISFMDPVTARRVGYLLEDGSTPTDGDQERGHVGKFGLFELGDLTIKNAAMMVPRIGFSPGGLGTKLRGVVPTQSQIHLGVDFLNANHVLVANNQGYLYMTYNGGRVFQTQVTSLAAAERRLEEGSLHATEFLSKAGAEALLRGTIAYRKNQFIEAEPDLRTAYDELKVNGGLESQAGRDNLGMLSRTLLAQEKYEEAIPLLQEFIRVEGAVSGPHHVNLAYAYSGLAGAYMSLHKYNEALAAMESAWPLVDKNIAPDQDAYAEFLYAYGTALEGTADYKRAEETYGRVLAAAEQRPEPDLRNMARALVNVGRMQETQERYQEAIGNYKRAREIYSTLPDNKEFLDFVDGVIKDAQEAVAR